MSINKVIICGNLVRDPEVRYEAKSQKAMARITVALDRGKTAEGVDRGADYPQAVFWGKMAELIERYCSKGTAVAVEGKIRTGSYTGKDGQKRYTTEIAGERIHFFRKAEEDVAKAKEHPDAPAAVDVTGDDIWSSQVGMDFTRDDDLPF